MAGSAAAELAINELIVNADDFGRSAMTNAGIVLAHEDGIVTSASLMVRPPAAEAAACYARTAPALSVGLHVDLGEWAYREEECVKVYEDAPVEDEIERQLARFRDLVGHDPTHLDSHQHVHREEPSASVMASMADELGVPLREHGAIHYIGDFYGQTGKCLSVPEAISVPTLIGIIESLDSGVSELGCHPGLDAGLDSAYRLERLREVEVLCDPHVRRALEGAGVSLRGF